MPYIAKSTGLHLPCAPRVKHCVFLQQCRISAGEMDPSHLLSKSCSQVLLPHGLDDWLSEWVQSWREWEHAYFSHVLGFTYAWRVVANCCSLWSKRQTLAFVCLSRVPGGFSWGWIWILRCGETVRGHSRIQPYSSNSQYVYMCVHECMYLQTQEPLNISWSGQKNYNIFVIAWLLPLCMSLTSNRGCTQPPSLCSVLPSLWWFWGSLTLELVLILLLARMFSKSVSHSGRDVVYQV